MRALIIAGATAVVAAATVLAVVPLLPNKHLKSKPVAAEVAEGVPSFSPAPAAEQPLAPRLRLPAAASAGAPSPRVVAETPARTDRNGPQKPEAARAEMRARLAASHRSNDRWTVDAADTFRRFASESRATLEGVRLSEAECFQDGCIVTATYDDHSRYEAMNATFPQSEAFLQWPGAKYRSPASSTPDAREEADWVLFNPHLTNQPSAE